MYDAETLNAMVRTYLNAVAEWDHDKLETLVADDVDYWMCGTLPLSGKHDKAELLGFIKSFEEIFEGAFRVTPIASTCEGNRIAVEAAGGGTFKNGTVYHNEYHMLFEFNEKGQLSKLREYLDTQAVIDAFPA